VAKRWVMFRIEEELHQELRELLPLWFSQWVKGSPQSIPGSPADGVISLSDVIGELLKRDQEHRARGKKKGKKGPRGSTGEQAAG